MKRIKWFFIVVLLLSFNLIYSAENANKKIVVMDFQNFTAYNAYDFLREYLRKTVVVQLKNRYNILDRAHYKELLRQINKISSNYLFDKNIGLQLGRVLNVHAVVMARYAYSLPSEPNSNTPTKLSLEVLVILIERGEAVLIHKTIVTAKSDLLRNAFQLVSKITGKIIASIK